MPDLPLLITLAALVGAAFSARGVWRRRAANAWPRAMATVTGAEVIEQHTHAQRREHSQEPARYLAKVEVCFTADGQKVVTDNRRFDATPVFQSRDAAEAYLKGFPAGATLDVRYDPSDPRIAQFGDSRLPTRRIGLTVFLLVMAGLALFVSLR